MKFVTSSLDTLNKKMQCRRKLYGLEYNDDHVGSLRALNEIFYQIINSLPTVVGSEGTVNAASLQCLTVAPMGIR